MGIRSGRMWRTQSAGTGTWSIPLPNLSNLTPASPCCGATSRRNGAVIKPSAAGPHLLQHRGRAVVFESVEELHSRVNDESLDIDENCVMVLKNCGPRGYPGMAEVGNMPIPVKLLRKGITDMVRVSDARMSGTAYGTVVLHVSPEAAAGGPLALVQTGDMITLDVPGRRIQLDVDDATLSQRRAQWTPRLLPNAGGQSFISTMYFRPMRERTSTSWSDAAALRFHATPIKQRGEDEWICPSERNTGSWSLDKGDRLRQS